MAGGFDSLGLMPELIRGVEEQNWLLPTDVQDEAIPLILGGGDVMVASETGSGKTAAFGLPVLQCVHERLRAAATMEKSLVPADSGPYNVRLSVSDKDSILMLQEDGLGCDNPTQQQWAGARATHGVRGGMYYFECTVLGGQGGICRVGWSTMAASLELGRDTHGYGYGGTAKKSTGNTFEDYGEKYGAGDCVGCLLDMEAGEIRFSKNGTELGTAFVLTETDRQAILFPAILLKGCAVTLNFGAAPFRHPPEASGEVFGLRGAQPVDIVAASSQEMHLQLSGQRKPMALILLPTKVLAKQVYENITALAHYVTVPSIVTTLLVGEGNTKAQKNALKEGVDVVVGTPARVNDLLQQKVLDLSMVHFFVLDEADSLVEGDTLPTVLALYNACPSFGAGEHRLQVCFFSATLHSPAIMKLANTICSSPTWVDLKGEGAVPETVHHALCRVDLDLHAQMLPSAGEKGPMVVLDEVHEGAPMRQKEADSLLVKELKQRLLVKIVDAFQMSQCIIFCRTNVDCNNLETYLCSLDGSQKFRGKRESGKEGKYSCVVVAGMRSSHDQRENLEAFESGHIRFLICTDVAARGIDIKGLPYVVNLTLPDESEQYIHRIGRVGRADCMGLAISIVSPVEEKVWFHTCKNRGKDGCSRRQLVSDGGCTVWYNEPEYLRNIERRLDMAIPELNPQDFSLPEELKSMQVQYGEVRVDTEQDEAKRRSAFHLDLLAPRMHELATMEFEAQNIFLAFQHDSRFTL